MILAGGTANRGGRLRSSTRVREGRPGRHRVAATAAALLATVGAAACGAGDEPGQAAPPVTTIVTTTSSTEPPTTTTTIDFLRPITQDTLPLADGAGPLDVVALLEDMRGQTADVALQVQRLAPFPGLPGPPVAQILDVEASLSPAQDDGTRPSTARVRLRVPESFEAARDLVEANLKGFTWNQSGNRELDVDGFPAIELTYREPGRSGDEQQLLVTIVDGALTDPTVIDYRYTVQAEPEEAGDAEGLYVDRLTAWTDDLPLPSGATLVSVSAAAADDQARLTAHHLITAADEAEAVADTLARIGSGITVVGVAEGETPLAGPLQLVDEDGIEYVVDYAPATEEGTFELTIGASFRLDPID